MNLKTFRIVALAEATSFLILLASSLIKHTADQPIGVEIFGPIHGGLFLIYVFMALILRINTNWTLWQTAAILLGAVVPTGGYFVDRWLLRHHELENA